MGCGTGWILGSAAEHGRPPPLLLGARRGEGRVVARNENRAEGHSMIFYLTTADTELLTLSHAVRGLPEGLSAVRAANPVGLSAEALERLYGELERSADLVIVRLLG